MTDMKKEAFGNRYFPSPMEWNARHALTFSSPASTLYG